MNTLQRIARPLPRALTAAAPPLLNPRTYSTAPSDFTHAVIGGGAVGLAIARRLARVPHTSTILLERHRAVGTETSSRNSEVIHAGLYYGAHSLKTRLCIAGRHALYKFCAARGVPHRRCGKWIVAQDAEQGAALQRVHDFARGVGVPTRFVGREEAARRAPAVRAEEAVLESESTGIVDSHAYMQALEGEFEEELGGTVALAAAVTHVEPREGGRRGWAVFTGGHGGDDGCVTADVLVNSAGLGACDVNNMVFDAASGRQRKQYYAKGSYYSYSASTPKTDMLVYPAPIPGHGGLGTHLTMDMAGRLRFGPDVEWVDDPTDLAPNPDKERFETALNDIQTYLPGLQREHVALDYSGIRPKLSPTHSAVEGEKFIDFYIKKEEGVENFVNLLGIESPGLTSSLAIGDYVHDLVYRSAVT